MDLIFEIIDLGCLDDRNKNLWKLWIYRVASRLMKWLAFFEWYCGLSIENIWAGLEQGYDIGEPHVIKLWLIIILTSLIM